MKVADEKNTNIYVQEGYLNREDYLLSISEEYGVEHEAVILIADMLGEHEDFDGLINALEDIEIANY
jgi:hypothetical protein